MQWADYVQHYYAVKYQIKRVQNQIQELNCLGGLPKKSTTSCGACHNNGSIVECNVVKMDGLQSKLVALETQLTIMRHRLEYLVDKLTNLRIREIVELRVIYGKSWKVIASESDYSVDYTRKLYAYGVADINKILEEEKR